MTRLVCLECSVMDAMGSVETMDLCAEHVTAEFTRVRDCKSHTALHPLLQIRKPIPDRKVYAVVSLARDALELQSDQGQSQ